MTTLRERRPTEPKLSRHPDKAQRLLVLGVVMVVGVVSATLAVLLGGQHGDVRTGSGTVRGSGVAASETRTLAPFTAVELAGSNNVSVQVGAPQSVVVHANDNLVGNVRTTVRSGTRTYPAPPSMARPSTTASKADEGWSHPTSTESLDEVLTPLTQARRPPSSLTSRRPASRSRSASTSRGVA